MPKEELKAVRQDTVCFSHEDFRVEIVPSKISSFNRRTPQLFHPELEIKFFYEGEAWLLVGEDNIHAQPGDIVIINPYDIHSTIGVGETPGKYILILVDLGFFSQEMASDMDLAHLLLSKQLRFNHLIRNNRGLNNLLEQLGRETDPNKAYYRAAIRGLLLTFFALLLRDEVNNQAVSPTHANTEKYYTVIEPALQMVRIDYRTSLNVDQLAELCNVSKSHFCRIFKLVTGRTVIQYVTDYRLKIAKMLLEYGNDSIAHIADTCGFQDEGYFCRCYKRKYHQTPKQDRIRASGKSKQ
ncbi:MAG: AraC family transcriptional regulator [Oscillospiraceae bacterium]|nr:AraC family transcriptional regulator [Oscillospiraceae bacterium]